MLPPYIYLDYWFVGLVGAYWVGILILLGWGKDLCLWVFVVFSA